MIFHNKTTLSAKLNDIKKYSKPTEKSALRLFNVIIIFEMKEGILSEKTLFNIASFHIIENEKINVNIYSILKRFKKLNLKISYELILYIFKNSNSPLEIL